MKRICTERRSSGAMSTGARPPLPGGSSRRFAPRAWGKRIVILDLAPDIPKEVLEAKGLTGVGGQLLPDDDSAVLRFHPSLVPPRLSSRTEAEALRKAQANRDSVDEILSGGLPERRDIIFINDASMYLQAGSSECLVQVLQLADTAVVNGYYGSGLGGGEISRRERDQMDRLAEWFRGSGRVIDM